MMTANDLRFLEHDDFQVGGVRVPRDLVGGFRDSTDVEEPHELRQRFLDDGYVFLRGVLDTRDVLAAREEVFSRLVDVGEIQSPAIEGIATGQSNRRELADDLVAFWRCVSEGPGPVAKDTET